MSDQNNKHAGLSAEVIEMPIARGEVTIEHLESKLDLTYNWGYEKTRQDLRDLYKKAQRSQWQPDLTLPWNTNVDLDYRYFPDEMFPLYGTPLFDKLDDKAKTTMSREMF